MGAGETAGTIVVRVDGVEVVLGPLPAGAVDLALVEALARLHLSARRRSCALRLQDPSAELLELLALAGLAELLAGGNGGEMGADQPAVDSGVAKPRRARTSGRRRGGTEAGG